MPVFNRESCLGQAVESILNQTYSNLELIIADDGSTDGSAELIRHYARKDSRVRAVLFPHRGIPKTSNAAAALACGQLIARQDSDDIALPDRLAVQYGWMKDQALDICGCCFSMFTDGIEEHPAKEGIRVQPSSQGAIMKEMLFGFPVLTGTMLMRSSVCKHDPFNEAVEFIDFGWAEEILFKYRVGNVPEVLLRVRRHEGNTTSMKEDLFRRGSTKSRFKYFYRLFPGTPLPDYLSFARLADGSPMTSLWELKRAGQWLTELASCPDEELQRRMSMRWRKTCERASGLGKEVNHIYHTYMERIENGCFGTSGIP